MCGWKGGRGASAGTLDVRARGPGPRDPLGRRVRVQGRAGGERGAGSGQRPQRGGPGSRSSRALLASPAPVSAGELESCRNCKLSHMTRNQDSAGSERRPNRSQAPDGARAARRAQGAEQGLERWGAGRWGAGLAAKLFQESSGEEGGGGVGGGGNSWIPGKLGDEEGKEKEGVLQAGANETSRALLPEGGCPLGDPGLASAAARLRAGPEELTYFGAEAALGRAEGGERGGQSEQGEQQAAGGPCGGRHGPRPSGHPGVRLGGGAQRGSRRPSLGRLCLGRRGAGLLGVLSARRRGAGSRARLSARRLCSVLWPSA